MADTTARNVIARELVHIANKLAWTTDDMDSDPMRYSAEYADAILSALLAAPESVRLDLAHQFCPDSHCIAEMTEIYAILDAGMVGP
jgi:hypothetical protein